MKLLSLLLITFSGSAIAQPYFSCDVQKPCSQVNVLGFCVEEAKIFLQKDKTAELVATVRKPSSNSVRPYVLSKKASDKFTFAKKDNVSRLVTGWDGFEHHITLYSSNGKSWGGRLTLEEDSYFRVQCTYSDFAKSTNRDMEYVASKQMGNFFAKAVPKGYTAQPLHPGTVQANSNFRALMRDLVANKKKIWRDFVYSAGKDEGYTAEDALNPERALGVKSIFTVDGIYGIYKGDKLIGYVYDLSDHIQAAIFQDGAGIVIYLNKDMELVKLDEWAA